MFSVSSRFNSSGESKDKRKLQTTVRDTSLKGLPSATYNRKILYISAK